MKYEDLVREIVSLYQRARESAFPHSRIFRGESGSISSETEDLFARHLIDLLPPDTKLFINQTITTGTRETRIRVKPDIVVVRNSQIKAILDLKMDLGRQRSEFPKFWDERDKLIPQMRGKEFSLFQKTRSRKQRLSFRFSSSAKLFFVIISDQNISPNQMDEVLKRKGKKRYSDTYILTQGLHPNAYGLSVDSIMKRIEIDNASMRKFEEELGKII